MTSSNAFCQLHTQFCDEDWNLYRFFLCGRTRGQGSRSGVGLDDGCNSNRRFLVLLACVGRTRQGTGMGLRLNDGCKEKKIV